MNVTLIGMSGAGKSHIGKLLAARLGLQFVDVDRDLLEKTHNKPLQDILDELGDQAFMDWEADVMIDYTKGKDNLLISSPGSVVYEKNAIDHLRDISRVVYLQVPYETVEKRIGSISTARGIVGRGSKSLRELYDERTPLCEQYAHFIVNTHKRDEDEILAEIVDFLHSGN